jgi:prepilin-type N-terminal cleavage/methylation domain-containing protein
MRRDNTLPTQRNQWVSASKVRVTRDSRSTIMGAGLQTRVGWRSLMKKAIHGPKWPTPGGVSGAYSCAPDSTDGHCTAAGIRRSQRAFTLIEVLVVVAILGVIATIVVMNIASFSSRGTVDAANTEARQVHTALIAYMQANNLRTWDGIVGDAETEDVEHYVLNPERLQARYTVSDGKVIDAFAFPDGRWASCTWDTDAGAWRAKE